jgi:PTS system mannose-specific IIA component
LPRIWGIGKGFGKEFGLKLHTSSSLAWVRCTKPLDVAPKLSDDFGDNRTGRGCWAIWSIGMERIEVMIGLVLVTHGGLARELLKAAEHVCGPQAQVETVCIEADDDLSARSKQIQEAAARVDTGAGLIFLTDVYGSTPFNAALAAANLSGTPVISGVNVPMLIKLASARKSDDLDAAVKAAKEAGQKYICVSGEAEATTAAQ